MVTILACIHRVPVEITAGTECSYRAPTPLVLELQLALVLHADSYEHGPKQHDANTIHGSRGFERIISDTLFQKETTTTTSTATTTTTTTTTITATTYLFTYSMVQSPS